MNIESDTISARAKVLLSIPLVILLDVFLASGAHITYDGDYAYGIVTMSIAFFGQLALLRALADNWLWSCPQVYRRPTLIRSYMSMDAPASDYV